MISVNASIPTISGFVRSASVICPLPVQILFAAAMIVWLKRFHDILLILLYIFIFRLRMQRNIDIYVPTQYNCSYICKI